MSRIEESVGHPRANSNMEQRAQLVKLPIIFLKIRFQVMSKAAPSYQTVVGTMIDGDLSCEARSVETPSSARFAHTPSSFGSHLLSVSSLYFLLDTTLILVKHNHQHHRFVETPSRVTSTVPSLSCLLDQRQRQRQDTRFFCRNPVFV